VLRKLLHFLAQAAVAGAIAAAGLVLLAPRVVPGPAAPSSASPAAHVPGDARQAVPGYRAAVAKSGPSVVSVYTARAMPRGARPGGAPFSAEPPEAFAAGLGSGVIVSASGYVLTNNHVIDGAEEIAVVLADGRIVEAKLVGVDPEIDLAVLKVASPGLQPIALGDDHALAVGDIVLAVGNPFGVGQTVTQGIVSATGRNRLGISVLENFIQTDAAINPGNSGGALIDANGSLVGVSTAIFSQTGGSQGIGFAIPISLARQVMDQIVATGRVVRGWLGISARDARDGGPAAGARVVGVSGDGPADRAGVRPGDVVLAIADQPVVDAAGLIAHAAVLAPGTRVLLKVERDGKTVVLDAEIGRRPALTR
jgi:serine protease DegQ